MSNISITEIPKAVEVAKQIQDSQLVKPLPFITASEVVSEFESRCANGMQYTTFPNRLSETEKLKLTSKGFLITENTVPSTVRYGAGDLYIGFQVALNNRATEEHMQITPNGSGGSCGCCTEISDAEVEAIFDGSYKPDTSSYEELSDEDVESISGGI